MLTYYAPTLIMLDIASTIIWSSFFSGGNKCAVHFFLKGKGNYFLLVIFEGGMVGFESRSLLIIYSATGKNNKREVFSYERYCVAKL